ncbi:MAG: hypothetical protein ABWY29_09975 [Blastococcus sp.]
MYARSTTVRGNPEKLDDGIAYVRDKVMPAVQQMDGCVGLSMLVAHDSGRSITTTAWVDLAAMRRNAENIRPIREKTAELMGGSADVAEWEIAVLHRIHETHDGACARVIWTTGDPARVDETIDAFRMTMISRIEELPGFCSVSVMVDRQSGRSAIAVTYDDRDAMQQAQERGMALRREFNRHLGRETTEVAEFDVVLAHLRVPEKV